MIFNYRTLRYVLLAPALLLIACEQEQQQQGEQLGRQYPVEVLTVQPESFERTTRVSGTIEAHEDAMVSAEANGRLYDLVRRGARVEEGEQIAEIDDELLQAQLEVARASYNLAEDTYERQQPLYEEDIISTLEFNQTRAQLEQARAELDRAQKQLREARVTSPFAGRVEERLIEPGEMVAAGTPILRLINTEQVRVAAGIPERYSNYITEGSPVTLHFRNSGEQRQAELSYAGGMVDPETRTVPVEVELENDQLNLKPEMSTRMEVVLEVLEDVIVIPRTAVIRDEMGTGVFVVNDSAKHPVAAHRSVETDYASGDRVVVTEGLEAGDHVVIAGQRDVTEGSRVRMDRQFSSFDEANDQLSNR